MSGVATARRAPTGSKRATKTAGIELDGNTATFAIARAGAIVEVDRVTGGLRDSVLARCASADRILVAWGAPTGTISERSLGVADPADVRSALDALAGPRVACARTARTPADRGECRGVVGLADAADVAELWPAGVNLQLVLAPMVLTSPGVWLGIRRSGAELTVVDDGGIRRSRALPGAGLDGIAAALSTYGGDGWGQLDDVLADPSRHPDIMSLVDRHTAALASEVKTTLASWRRTVTADATTVMVYGLGSALPTLESRLSDQGIAALAPPAGPASAGLDAATRAEAWLAIEAALADHDEFVGFADLRGAARRDALTRAARRTRRLVTLTAVGAAATGGVLIPIGQGRLVHHLAAGHLAASHREITRLAPQEAVYRYVRTASDSWSATAASEPDWGRLLDAILKSAPPPVDVLSVDADDTTQPGAVTVVVHAQGGPQAFIDLERWATTLASNRAVQQVFAPSAESDALAGRGSTKTTFELQFVVAASALATARPFPGGHL